MTVYAYDETRRALITIWDTGLGCVASTLADLPATAVADDAIQLASSLTELSRQAWRTYTHPASAADSLDVNTEGWRREGEREAFATVVQSIRHPNLPDGNVVIQSYVRVEEAAHRVGRALHALGDPDLTDHVAADVEAELAAVEQAELGDLTGRAKQAVLLTRADASPLQVSAANELLHDHPLGSTHLLQDVDPTAAAVAAAHWLQAAANVAAATADCDPTEVVHLADDLEALAVKTPTLVLQRLNAGEKPREVVIDLITSAMTAAEGKIPDLDALARQMVAWKRLAQRIAPDEQEQLDALTPRVAVLDPLRPAHDLLEDLLGGIHGAWLIYEESAAFDDEADVEELDDITEVDDEDAQEEDENEQYQRRYDRVMAEFFEAVRAEAAEHQDRLA